MKCQRCGITLPNLGDADYKKAAEMEAEIASLKAELENWRKRGASVVANVAGLVKEVDRLKADKARLIETLKIYADKKNWSRGLSENHGLTNFLYDTNGPFPAYDTLDKLKEVSCPS